MRIRVAVAALAAAGALAACSSGHSSHPSSTSPHPSTSLTSVKQLSGYCKKLATGASALTKAQSGLYTDKNGAASKSLERTLTSLQSGAPPEVQAALADMITQFRAAEALLPRASGLSTVSASDAARLNPITTKLVADGKIVSSYFDTHCR